MREDKLEELNLSELEDVFLDFHIDAKTKNTSELLQEWGVVMMRMGILVEKLNTSMGKMAKKMIGDSKKGEII